MITHHKLLVAILAIVAVLVVWFAYQLVFPQRVLAPEEESPIVTTVRDKTGIITKTDVSKTGGSKLPVGFPTSIPVEGATVTDSYKGVYAGLNVVQYTVSYTSKKTRDELWTIYSDFMSSSGYKVDTQATSKSLSQISGVKGDDTLSVVVSSHSGVSLVQLSYLDR